MGETKIIQRLEEEMKLHKKTRKDEKKKKKGVSGSHLSFDDTPNTIKKNSQLGESVGIW